MVVVMAGARWLSVEVRGVFDATELVVELHFGCGGDDSKDFVADLYQAYARYALSLGFKSEILDSSYGHVVVKYIGKNVWSAFRCEAGKHVVQRIPRTERNGRKQTSVISVSVLPLPPEKQFNPLPDAELHIITQRGHGCGGQHQNKTDSAVRMKHIPTGLMVFINGRDQKQNKRDALRILTGRVNELRNSTAQNAYGEIRRQSVDTGRGNKTRTYNFMRSEVEDHVQNVRTKRIDLVMKGRIDLLQK